MSSTSKLLNAMSGIILVMLLGALLSGCLVISTGPHRDGGEDRDYHDSHERSQHDRYDD